MQKILAKYGLAAHLALLAVAPLFLFPFLQDAQTATVLLWLAVLAMVWVLASPSLRRDEMPHDARIRTWRHMVRDPLLWTLLAVVLFFGLRAANSGIARNYDSESGQWLIASATLPWLPGSVMNCGYLPFASAFAFMVVALGVRHSLGSSARMAFLSIAAALSGLAAAIALFAANDDIATVKKALECGICGDHLVGTAFAVNLLGGVVALVAAFEHGWSHMLPILSLFIGMDVAASFAFLSPVAIVIFLTALVLLTAYAFVFLHKAANGSIEYKFISILAIAFAIGWLVVFVMVPSEVVSTRIDATFDRSILSGEFLKVRAAVSDIAVRAWRAHVWTGVGCGSTSLAIEFFAEDADWLKLPVGIATIPNGWLRMLTEEGIIGVAMLMLPIVELCFVYVSRLVAAGRFEKMSHPACWMLPVVAIALAALGFFDVSPFRAEVLMLFGAICATSVNSIVTDRK